jgi:hypothetical protein
VICKAHFSLIFFLALEPSVYMKVSSPDIQYNSNLICIISHECFYNSNNFFPVSVFWALGSVNIEFNE